MMAKDPAFLFYSSDFLVGTMTMTNEQVGKYIRLLCLQHQKGKLTNEDFEHFDALKDERIRSKFKEIDGFFYNEKLKNESDRRKSYSLSRANNRKSHQKDMFDISDSYEQHMETETVTETITVNRKRIPKEKPKVVPPTLDEWRAFWRSEGYSEERSVQVFKSYADNDWTDSKGTPIKNWKMKCRQVWFKPENKINQNAPNQKNCKPIHFTDRPERTFGQL